VKKSTTRPAVTISTPEKKKKLANGKANGSSGGALDHALRYAKEGIRVIWIPRGRKAPIKKGWPKLATTKAATIKRWAAEHPRCNFGLAMGNGFIGIDLDLSRHPMVLKDLKARGLNLTETVLHMTPGGGMHLLYRGPKNIIIKNSESEIADGVDIKHEGGQLVCPGSVHPNGGVYKIAPEGDVPIAQLPKAWLKRLTEKRRAPSAKKAIEGTIPAGQGHAALISLIGALHRQGVDDDTIFAAVQERNKKKAHPVDDKELWRLVRSRDQWPLPDAQQLLDDPRPKVLLSGEGRVLSAIASELAEYLRDSLYVHDREVVIAENGKLRAISSQEFRTLVEKTLMCCRKSKHTAGVEIGMTMSNEEARGLLASHQLREGLRTVARVNTVRLPVLRGTSRKKHVELLPEGYDPDTQTLTLSEVEYAEDMPFDKALKVFRDLFAEFEFGDDGRSLAVTVAATLGLYGAQLIPTGELRPACTVTKNAEGAGATLLVACIVVPILGRMPISTKSSDDDEVRKTITSAVREGRTVLVFDNLKGRLDSQALEALVSSVTWSDRLLTLNQTIEMDHNITVFCTSNGVAVSADWRRRTLFIELHLTAEHAEDRKFKQELSEAKLRTKRAAILAACYALVRNWVKQGMPASSLPHSHCPAWARTFGGMVEAAGLMSPLAPADVGAEADEDGESMRVLVEAMTPGTEYGFKEIVTLCAAENVFTGMVGNGYVMMDSSHRSAFGYVLKKFRNRKVKSFMFFIDGKGHAKRYRIETLSHGKKSKQTVQTVQRDGKVLKFTPEGHRSRVNIGDLRKSKLNKSSMGKP
jgi:hypothetical protein